MIGLFAYLVSLAIIIFASLSVSVLCSVKVFQPPGLFDSDSSTGAQARKWLIVCIGVACVARCLFSSVEFIIFAINIVKENKPTSSISYYAGFDHTTISRLLFACRVLPTLLFLTYYALIGDYFGSLFYTIKESSYYATRAVYCVLASVTAVVIVVYLAIFPNPEILNAACLATVLFLSAWIIRHAYGINKFYVNNEDVLLESSNMDQGRLLARMQRVVAVALVALLSCAVVYCADLNYWLPRRHFYARSALDLSVVLFSEVCCAWVLVSLLSNRLTSVEGKLRQFFGAQAMRLMSSARGNGSAGSSSGARGSVSLVPMATAHRTGDPATAAQREEMQLLQQQQLLRRYGNYESIPLGEASEP
jgi:hypothetical protein